MLFQDAAIPPSSICARFDLSGNSADIMVVDLVVDGRTISLINLYIHPETRAGVKLLEGVLRQLGPGREILLFMDSNSHHVLWDSLTTSRRRDEDEELHDLVLAYPLALITPPDVPTHIPSNNVIDLGFASTSLLRNIHNVTVDQSLGLASDHWPITYEIDLTCERITLNRFNRAKMNVDRFLDVLRHELQAPIPAITDQRDLDEMVELLCRVLRVALEGSTPRCRPCSHSKRWWRPELDLLCATYTRAENVFSRRLRWREFLRGLDRVNVYDVLERIKLKPRSVFPSLVDLETGVAASGQAESGRILGKAWFGGGAEVIRGGGVDGREGNGTEGRGVEDENGDENHNKNENDNNSNVETVIGRTTVKKSTVLALTESDGV
ncbi:Endonuclease/exonuclease/phosphatase [Mycena alexandri]|uniref:Endonuclease/exonuclease/phosphatase n=1 Tax=Mycena alexandri TaxID=1745969 RepID=A0AAD6WJW7_9AGAR|nr:Endonuclease/exonuclease/phosphatase [Mycena alexandri]